jgi:pimeloyl-ACP methyl ester carboxylesterase
MAESARRVIFLPGASGAGRFWEPVAGLLPADWRTSCLDLPGLGDVPANPQVVSLDGVVDFVIAQIEAFGDGLPVDLVAQSMGGVVAVQLVLRRPELVRRLVLVATSGGLNFASFDAARWQAEYRASYPSAAAWVTEYDHDDSVAIATVQAPTLLLWAEGDAISPPTVGRHLEWLLPGAHLVVLEGGDHWFARDRADEVAPHILAHLQA